MKMHKVKKYTQISRDIKENKKNDVCRKIYLILSKYSRVQLGILIVSLLWYPTFGLSHIEEYGYTLESLIWARNTEDSVLFPLFLIQLLTNISLIIYIIKKGFSENELEDLDNDGVFQDGISIFLFVSLVGFLALGFFNIHLGNLICISLAIFISTFIFKFLSSTFFKRIKKFEVRNLYNEKDKLFKEILEDEEELAFLKKNMYVYRHVYNKVIRHIVENNKDSIFDTHYNKCKKKNQEMKEFEEQISVIENT
jgi:hypothetical protein